LMPSQKFSGWVSKNFVLQGYVEVLENRRNAVGRTFCDAVIGKKNPTVIGLN
jgi:hypothetical protein